MSYRGFVAAGSTAGLSVDARGNVVQYVDVTVAQGAPPPRPSNLRPPSKPNDDDEKAKLKDSSAPPPVDLSKANPLGRPSLQVDKDRAEDRAHAHEILRVAPSAAASGRADAGATRAKTDERRREDAGDVPSTGYVHRRWCGCVSSAGTAGADNDKEDNLSFLTHAVFTCAAVYVDEEHDKSMILKKLQMLITSTPTLHNIIISPYAEVVQTLISMASTTARSHGSSLESARLAFAQAACHHSELKELVNLLLQKKKGKVWLYTTVQTCAKCRALFQALGAEVLPPNQPLPECFHLETRVLPETAPGLIVIVLK